MKFYGSIGFWTGQDIEVKPGVFSPEIIEKTYAGDVDWHNRHFVESDKQNDNLKLNNQISILTDLYFQQNFSSIKYVIWGGTKWKVTNVNVGYPRAVLTIGGIYNGSRTEKINTSRTVT